MLNSTEEQRANLRALADYLNTGVTEYEFQMKKYAQRNDTLCGTAACAAGHLPFVLGKEKEVFGQSLPEAVKEDRSGFIRLSDKIIKFTEQHTGLLSQFNAAWDFLFGGNWPNDPRKAAARIYWLLENEVVPPKELWDSTKEPWNNPAPLPVITSAKESIDEETGEESSAAAAPCCT